MGKNPREAWKIYVVPTAGGSYRRVVWVGRDASGPTWSPDSSTVLFSDLLLNEVRDAARPAIHSLNLKSGAVSDVPGSSGLWTARYSPDGAHIAALTTDSRTVMLFTCSVGKWSRLLTTMPISDLEWSHSGEYLYYRVAPFRNTASIFRIGIADRSISPVVTVKADSEWSAWWFGLAPDDAPIEATLAGSQEIYSLDAHLP